MSEEQKMIQVETDPAKVLMSDGTDRAPARLASPHPARVSEHLPEEDDDDDDPSAGYVADIDDQ